MTDMIIGRCEICGGKITRLDPFEDRILTEIFGDTFTEHLPDCPDYPRMTEVRIEDLR